MPRLRMLLSAFSLLLLLGAPLGAEEAAAEDEEEAQYTPEQKKLLKFWPRLVDRRGKLDKRRYKTLSKEYGDKDIDEMLGPDYDFFHDEKPRDEDFPLVWQRPAIPREKIGNEKNWRPERTIDYHLGEITDKEGQIMVEGEVIHLNGNRGELDTLYTFEARFGTFRYGPWGRRRDEGMPHWRGASRPFAMARSAGNGPWNVSSAILFKSGHLAASGNGTSDPSYPYFQFPKHKVPMAVAVTARNEFILVAVWDTKEYVGQLAVLAVASFTPPGKWLHEWDWAEPFPGMHNTGMWDTIKLLGYVDLPIYAPTAISTAADNQPWTFYRGIKNQMNVAAELPFREQRIRDSFYNGPNRVAVARGGYAVLIGKYEKKACWVDLQPLFEYYREMYFATQEKFDETRNLGDEPDEWPYCFEDMHKKKRRRGDEEEPAKASPKPVVVATAEFEYPPTAVLASQSYYHDQYIAWGKGSRRANDPYTCIATVDGTLHLFRVGNLLTPSVAGGNDVAAGGTVAVGRNPCCLQYSTSCFNWHLQGGILVVARGEREIQWVKAGPGGGQVYRRLKDRRLEDPVYVEPIDTNGAVLQGMTVCDFAGEKLIGYRFGVCSIRKQHMPLGEDGNADCEVGYILELRGHPFLVSDSNMP